MTNPKDPRTPQERAYSLDETGDDDTRVLYTSDPTEAYGRPVSNPTLVYPQYDPRFDPAAQPNPTQQLGQPGYPPAQHQPPPGSQPPSAPPAESGKGPRGPRWGLLALAAGVLIVLGGVVGFLLSSTGSDDTATATRPTTTAAPAPTTTAPAPAPTPAVPPGLPLDELPGGLGEVIGQSGAVVGTITANDGTSLTLSGIGGSLVTVQLTPETQIIALAGNTPDALVVGATAVATGTPVEQGQMTADTVVSASLPTFGRPGN